MAETDTHNPWPQERGEWGSALASAAWTFTLRPWLEEQLEIARTALVGAKTLDDVRYLQGKAQAYQEILAAPQRFADVESALAENERESGQHPIGEQENEPQHQPTGTNAFWSRLRRRSA